jgi:hypothetical protein
LLLGSTGHIEWSGPGSSGRDDSCSRDQAFVTSSRLQPAPTSGSATGSSHADRPVVPGSGRRATPRYTLSAAPPGRYAAGTAPIVQWPRTPPFQGGNTGSNPVGGTHHGTTDNYRSCARRGVRPSSPPCQGGDRGIEARRARTGQVAQLAEHAAENRGVGSSILPLATKTAGGQSRDAPGQLIRSRLLTSAHRPSTP